MTALDFPDTPTSGQVFDKWTWNGTAWVLTTGWPTAWVPFSYAAGWSAAAGYSGGRYRLEGDRVWFDGIVQSDNAATHNQITTLPVGFRPPADRIYAGWAYSSPTSTYRVDVTSAGIVNLQGGLTGAVPYLSLDQISFSTKA